MMYCPKCGTQNMESAKFCRSCGADIVAVLEQLTGHLPQDRTAEQANRRPTAPADEASPDATPWDSMFDWVNKPSSLRPPLAPMIKMNWLGAETHAATRKSGRNKEAEAKTKEAKIEDGIQSLFWGIGFLCVAIAIGLFMPGGRFWWFWMLIPAFGFMGGGVAEITRYRLAQSHRAPSSDWPQATAAASPPSFTSQATRGAQLNPTSEERSTSAIFPPPGSVTEGTTRHLDARDHANASGQTPLSGQTNSERPHEK